MPKKCLLRDEPPQFPSILSEGSHVTTSSCWTSRLRVVNFWSQLCTIKADALPPSTDDSMAALGSNMVKISPT